MDRIDEHWLEHVQFRQELPDWVKDSPALAVDPRLKWYIHDQHQCLGALIAAVTRIEKEQRVARARAKWHQFFMR